MALTLHHHNFPVCAAKVRVALAKKSLGWESRIRPEILHPGFLWRDRLGVMAWFKRLKACPSPTEILDWYAPKTARSSITKERFTRYVWRR